MSTDNIIQFPGGEGPDDASSHGEGSRISGPGTGIMGIPGLTEDQEKALQVILGGTSFVCIGISPTESGADFYTAIDGDAKDISDALPHLDGVISRACGKRGLT